MILLLGWLGINATAQVGGFDPGFNAGVILNGADPGIVRAHLVSGGKHLIAGDFTLVGGVARGNLAKLNADGSPDPTFATGAGANGPVHAIALDSSGRLVIGGEFTTYDGVARNRIARLTATGALDPTFNPGTGCDGTVLSIALTNSSLYLGGEFTTVNGTTRNRLAALTNDGNLGSLTFNGGVNATVRALLVDARGNLLAGGDFTDAGGAVRNYFAQFSSVSGTLNGTNLELNGPVRTIDLWTNPPSSSETTVYIGGDFTRVGAVPRGRLASLKSNFAGQLSLDAEFDFWLDAPCRKILAANATKILVAGDFTSVNGQGRARFATLSFFSSNQGISSIAYWSLTTGYGETGPDGSVYAIGLDGDGKPLLGGAFEGFPSNPRNALVRLYGDAGSLPPVTPTSPSATTLSDTQIALSWGSSAFASAYSVESSPTGVSDWTKIYSGASTSFTDAGLPPGTQRFYRVHASNYNGESAFTSPVSTTTNATAWSGAGSLQNTFPPGAVNGAVSAILRQPDGKIVIAGSFTNVLGTPRKYIARLLPDLTLDPSFDPGVGANSSITQIQSAPDGGIYIFGTFSTVSGSTRNDIARLTAGGALDKAFNTNADWTFADGIRSQADGRLIVYGGFQTFFGSPRDYIARLNLDGSNDPSFGGFSKGSVDAVALQTDGKLLITSIFGTINGISGKYFARLTTSGALDPLFAGSATSSNITSLESLPSGSHFAAGSFTTLSGVSRKYIARLNPNGTVDPSFDPGASTNTASPRVFPQPDGKVIIAGTFSSVANTTRWKIARLNANGTLDPDFRCEAGPGNGNINAVLPLPDGSLLVGGLFTTFGTSSRGYLVHLKGDAYAGMPSAPQNLTGAALSNAGITLTWNQLPDEYGWKLERSARGTGAWQQIAELRWDFTSFTDTGLSQATAYDYRIRAWNGAGASAYSNTLTARTLNAFETWKIDHGFPVASLDGFDNDGDGVGLFLEYALDLDPAAADSDGMPLADAFAGVLAMSYPKLRPELTYVVEASTDLQTWSSARVQQGSGGYPTAWTPIGDEPRIFLRLRISQAEAP